MSDRLDRLLNESRPPDATALPGVADRAREVAAGAASGEGQPFRPRRPRWWNFLVFGTVAVAASAAAIPPLVAWAPWEPDLVVSREFPVTDGGELTNCVVIVRVGQDEHAGGADAGRHLDEARRFLQDGDWSDITVDLDDVEAYLDAMTPQQRALREEAGISNPHLLSMLASNEITSEFEEAGYLKHGVWLESMGTCDEVGE
ncbi:hypothetical protein [Mycetocola zhadangensis]|uniref:Uncharacterized protein n=1 Tax=Mycetocola zhadangensis TaxID=1164595 RepID=A0A3L7J2N0_9MICO|nr:hypothetical protein [Mycetocola zhadangensis]RLQ84535.1 hypothetical protein D9V28_10215 [Mycetocola zhadangensis]GGE92104.1 hypothetical protein GCM10011313_13770 [Mycetocola zhadangensis]